jgi:hypothetical protein
MSSVAIPGDRDSPFTSLRGVPYPAGGPGLPTDFKKGVRRYFYCAQIGFAKDHWGKKQLGSDVIFLHLAGNWRTTEVMKNVVCPHMY